MTATKTSPISRTASDLGPWCRPDTARCETSLDPEVVTDRCCLFWQRRLLRDTAWILDLYDVPWSIDYGTLLGYCTGGEPEWRAGGRVLGGHEPGGVGRAYWNDKDVDLSALEEDREKVLALIPYWELLGYHVRYYPPGRRRWVWGDCLKIRLSPLNKVNVDITFWRRASRGILDRHSYGPTDRFKGREFPEQWMFPTTRGEWEGIAVNVPADPVQRVEHIYGPDWRNLPAVRHAQVER